MSDRANRLRRTAFVAMALALLGIFMAALEFRPLSGNFMPHYHCLDAARHPVLLWTTVVANLMVAGAYYVIPGLLILAAIAGYAPAPGMFYLFAAFILACGTTHLFDVLVIWRPAYWLQAAVLVITGTISWITVAQIVLEARRAVRALTLAGQKLQEASREIREGNIGAAQSLLSEVVELVSAVLHRFQLAPPAAELGG